MKYAHCKGLYLKCRLQVVCELFSYMLLLYEVCPYFKFGYLAAKGSIAEATKNEDKVHIINFQILQGGPCVTLILGLARQPGNSYPLP